ncbi:MAG: peptide chain release factor 2 [Erysipelotrichales bacterium]|nr:peptide chain release factor 2 [Erysipelotrichales bacterium]
MELFEIKQGIESTRDKLQQLGDSLDLPSKKEQIHKLEQMQLEDGFWGDQRGAKKVIDACNALKELCNMYESLDRHYSELADTYEMVKDSFDADLLDILEEDYRKGAQEFEAFELRVLLSHPYDRSNAILEIHPGAGGTESQDWAEMLFRMYSRYGERHGFKVKVLDYQEGEEAGIKSVSILIDGPFAYGYMKAEKGVHRLVRISPFDSGGRRHTSFASVDVMPEFQDDIEIVIEDKDLQVDTMRASGAGGQHVNKTDSAVRMTHIPTGITVTCQTERSQIQNRERCLNMLKSKLYQRHIEEQEAKLAAIKGEQKAIEWGSQIRSYVFCPYTMVKDHRTNYEVGNVDSVMDGAIDGFIYEYLKKQI